MDNAQPTPSESGGGLNVNLNGLKQQSQNLAKSLVGNIGNIGDSFVGAINRIGSLVPDQEQEPATNSAPEVVAVQDLDAWLEGKDEAEEEQPPASTEDIVQQLTQKLAELQEARNAVLEQEATERSRLLERLTEVQKNEELHSAHFNQALREKGQEHESAKKCAKKLQELLEASKAETERWQSIGKKCRMDRLAMRLGKNRKIARMHRALSFNIMHEMRVATEGRVVDKLTLKNGITQTRLIALCDKEQELRWGPLPGPLSSHSKGVKVASVLRVDYGHDCVNQRRFRVHPWLCFSLRNTERSFDFVCPDDFTVGCFVLALSRVCVNAVGRIMTRRQFASLKGWSKIREYCKHMNISIGQAFLSALKARDMQREIGDVLSMEALFNPSQERSRGSTSDTNGSTAPSQGNAASSSVVANDRMASSTTMEKPASSFCSDRRPSSSMSMSTTMESRERRLTSGSNADKRPFRAKNWPKAGETWVFTGVLEDVDVFKDQECTHWLNRLRCRKAGSGLDRQAVTILTAKPGQFSLEIRGADKMRFVKGWMSIVDRDGNWVIEPWVAVK